MTHELLPKLFHTSVSISYFVRVMSLCPKFTFIYSDCLSVIFESKEKDYLELKFLIFDSTLFEKNPNFQNDFLVSNGLSQTLIARRTLSL